MLRVLKLPLCHVKTSSIIFLERISLIASAVRKLIAYFFIAYQFIEDLFLQKDGCLLFLLLYYEIGISLWTRVTSLTNLFK